MYSIFENECPPSQNALLQRINTSPHVQHFFDNVCANVWMLLHEYTMYEAVQRHNAWQGVVDPELYSAVLHTQLRLCTSNSPYRSGSVTPEDVPEVLASGNIRERCHVLYTLLGRRSHLWAYLANTPREDSRLAVSQTAAQLYLHTDSMFCNGALVRMPKIKNSTAQILVAAHEPTTVFCARYERQCNATRLAMRIRTSEIIPRLSHREKRMLPYCTLNRSTVLTSWVTGRMQWELDASCDFVQEASARGESVTAGISGHTDVLFRILACFDVPRQPEIAALACVLWLVGCDHHSVYEVRYTAKFHGVPFDECKSSSEWLQDLLYQAESKSADAAPQRSPPHGVCGMPRVNLAGFVLRV